MTWADLNAGKTVYGHRVSKVNKLGGSQGLPDQPTLDALLSGAQGLALTSVYTGMSFAWANATVHSGTVTISKATSATSAPHEKSASVCHEDNVFPVDPGSNLHMVIRQSMAPCSRCRASFQAWAKQRQSSIIVSADKGYDGSPDDTVFIFAPTGAVYQWCSAVMSWDKK